MPSPLAGAIDQVAYIVTDLDASVQRWIDHIGVGPWTVFRNVALPGRYRGQETTVTMDVALGYRGDVQIELIRPTGSGMSPYKSDEGAPLVGLHHVAWIVDDRDEAVAAARAGGLEILFEGESEAVRVAYLIDPAEPETRFELIEGAQSRPMQDAGIAASRDWDGSNPVTVIDFAA